MKARTKKTTAYIAGPMRGYPRYNFDAFDAAQADLESCGFKVLSPAAMDREIGFDPDRDSLADFDMEAAFDRDTAAIKQCDMLVLLPGHEQSTGATAEKHVALWLGKRVLVYAGAGKGLIPLENTEDILHEAYRLTAGDRNNQYGPPDQDFARTAKMWEAILEPRVVDGKLKLKPSDVASCMIALKLSRLSWNPKRDSYTDVAGYARCGWICEGQP